jgi:hypothetical protein
MDEQELKRLWQSSDKPTLELMLKPDIDKFETRYRYLLRTTHLLYERRFHIKLNVFIVLIFLFLTFSETHEWYSYLLSFIVLIGLWYIFYITDRLRDAIASVLPDLSLLIQMRLRQNILNRLSILRTINMIYGVIVLICIWSFRFPVRRFDATAIGSMVFIFLLAFGVERLNRRKLKTTRTYLDNIVKALERE